MLRGEERRGEENKTEDVGAARGIYRGIWRENFSAIAGTPSQTGPNCWGLLWRWHVNGLGYELPGANVIPLAFIHLTTQGDFVSTSGKKREYEVGVWRNGRGDGFIQYSNYC